MASKTDLLQTPVRRLSLRRKRSTKGDGENSESPAHKKTSPRSTIKLESSTIKVETGTIKLEGIASKDIDSSASSSSSTGDFTSQVYQSRRKPILQSNTPSRGMTTPKHLNHNNNSNGMSSKKKSEFKRSSSDSSQHIHLHSPDGPFMSSQICGTQDCEVVWCGTQDMEVFWDCRSPDILIENLKQSVSAESKSCERISSPASLTYTLPHRALFNKSKSLQSTSVSLSSTTDQLDALLNQIAAKEKENRAPSLSISEEQNLDEALLGDDSLFPLSPETEPSTPPISSDLLLKPLSQPFKVKEEKSPGSTSVSAKVVTERKSSERSMESNDRNKALTSKCINTSESASNKLKMHSPDVFDDDLFDDIALDSSGLNVPSSVQPAKIDSGAVVGIKSNPPADKKDQDIIHDGNSAINSVLPMMKNCKSADVKKLGIGHLSINPVKDRGKAASGWGKKCEVDEFKEDDEFPDDFFDDFLVQQSQSIEKELEEKGFEKVLAKVKAKSSDEDNVPPLQRQPNCSNSNLDVCEFVSASTVPYGNLRANSYSKDSLITSSTRIDCNNSFKIKEAKEQDQILCKSLDSCPPKGKMLSDQKKDVTNQDSKDVRLAKKPHPFSKSDGNQVIDNESHVRHNNVPKKPSESQSVKETTSKKKVRSTFNLSIDSETLLPKSERNPDGIHKTSKASSHRSNAHKLESSELPNQHAPKLQVTSAVKNAAIGHKGRSLLQPSANPTEGSQVPDDFDFEDDLFKDDFDTFDGDVAMLMSQSEDFDSPHMSENTSGSSVKKESITAGAPIMKNENSSHKGKSEAQLSCQYLASSKSKQGTENHRRDMVSSKFTSSLEEVSKPSPRQKSALEITDDDLFGDGVLALIDNMESQANSQSSSQSSTSSEKRYTMQEIEQKKAEAKRRKESRVNVDEINRKKEEALKRREERQRRRQQPCTGHQSLFKR